MRMPSPRRLMLLSGLAVALVVAMPSSAPAADVHPEYNGFLRTGKYALRKGRQRERAEIYHSRRCAAFLILGSSYGKPIMLSPRTQTIQEARPQDVVVASDGSRALTTTAQLKNLGRMRRNRQTIQIQVPSYTAALVPNPPLLGWAGRTEMTEHTPEYAQTAERYKPDAAAIRALVKPNEPIQVYVYFGSWCHTCSTLLGAIIRVEQELEGSGITFRYYGLPKPPAMYRDKEVRTRGIKKLPTGLIYSGNKLLGQVVSTTWQRPEAALRKVLGR